MARGYEDLIELRSTHKLKKSVRKLDLPETRDNLDTAAAALLAANARRVPGPEDEKIFVLVKELIRHRARLLFFL